jgi:hypothetical protein
MPLYSKPLNFEKLAQKLAKKKNPKPGPAAFAAVKAAGLVQRSTTNIYY